MFSRKVLKKFKLPKGQRENRSEGKKYTNLKDDLKPQARTDTNMYQEKEGTFPMKAMNVDPGVLYVKKGQASG